jgi:hypothetical protein
MMQRRPAERVHSVDVTGPRDELADARQAQVCPADAYREYTFGATPPGCSELRVTFTSVGGTSTALASVLVLPPVVVTATVASGMPFPVTASSTRPRNSAVVCAGRTRLGPAASSAARIVAMKRDIVGMSGEKRENVCSDYGK